MNRRLSGESTTAARARTVCSGSAGMGSAATAILMQRDTVAAKGVEAASGAELDAAEGRAATRAQALRRKDGSVNEGIGRRSPSSRSKVLRRAALDAPFTA